MNVIVSVDLAVSNGAAVRLTYQDENIKAVEVLAKWRKLPSGLKHTPQEVIRAHEKFVLSQVVPKVTIDTLVCIDWTQREVMMRGRASVASVKSLLTGVYYARLRAQGAPIVFIDNRAARQYLSRVLKRKVTKDKHDVWASWLKLGHLPRVDFMSRTLNQHIRDAIVLGDISRLLQLESINV